MFKIVWLELLPTPPSTQTSLLLRRHFIGCLLNTVPYSRLPYWCTSFYIVVIQNILHLFLNPDRVSIIHAKAKQMVCSLRSPTLPLQYISLLRIFGLSFAYDTPKIGNDLPDDVHLTTSLHSFRRKLKTYLFAQAYQRSSVAYWLSSLASNHRLSPLWVRVPQVAILRTCTCPNMTLAVERDVKPQL